MSAGKGKTMIRIDRIEEVLREKQMSKRGLEREAGIGTGNIQKWKTTNPSTENVKKVANVLGVSVAYLTGESDFRSEQDALIDKWNKQMSADLPDLVRKIEAGIRIPVLGSVPCGIPTEAIEFFDSDEWEEISEVMARSGHFFGLKVKGDSMSPRICDGDILIVQQTSEAESGDIVVAKVNGQDACCKKLIVRDDGIVLQSFNPMYDPMVFSKEEIQSKPVQILGKVVENRQKFR